MKIYDYKLIKPFSWCLVLCMSFFLNTLSAQEELVCDDVQISVGADCTFDAAEATFTESAPSGVATITFSTFPPTEYAVGAPVTLECGTYSFTVTDNSGNRCWGTAVVEDKLPPVSKTNPCPPDAPCAANCLDVETLALNDASTLISGDVDGDNPNTNLTDLLGIDDCSGPVSVIKPEGPIIAGDQCESDSLDYWYIYSFVDAKGNVGADTLAYRVGKLNIADITFPETYEGSCQDDDLDPSKTGNISHPDAIAADVDIVFTPAPDGSGYTGSLCNLILTYMDVKTIPACEQDIPQCGNSRKVLRMWQVIDWCGKGIRDSLQILSLKDTLAPTITPQDTIYSSTDPWSCSATVSITVPGTDECSPSGLRYTLLGPAGVNIERDGGVTSNKFKVLNAPKGLHLFQAYAEDCCGNISEPDSIYVRIWDQIKPTAIAKEFTVASLVKIPGQEEAIAKVLAASIDNGSYDMCTPVYLEVRRVDANNEVMDDKCDEDDDGDYDEEDDWGPFVKFCCDDVWESWKVELRVWDDADMNGIYGTAGDNYNTTWGWVKIEDPNPPVIDVECVEAYCHDDYENLDLSADVTGACGGEAIEPYEVYWFGTEPSDKKITDAERAQLLAQVQECAPAAYNYVSNGFPDFDYTCGYGFGFARYEYEGNKGTIARAIQLIIVKYKDDFTCDNVDWPDAHITETDCLPPAPDALDWVAGPCELIGWNLESDTFQFETDACYKVVNEYTVIDWCVYDAYKRGAAYGHYFEALWDHEQPTTGHSNDGHEDVNCTENPDDDTEHATTGIYTFYQTIKVLSDEGPDVTVEDVMIPVTSDNCSVDFTLTAEADGDCPGTWLKWQLQIDTDGDGQFDDILSPVLYAGEYDLTTSIGLNEGMKTWEARWKVWDGCGQVTLEPFTIMIVDKKAPTPYCINLSSALMQPNANGVSMVELWAADFDLNSSDFCFDTDHLYFTFAEDGNPVPPNTNKLDEVHYFITDGDGGSVDVTSVDGIEDLYIDGELYNGQIIYKWLPYDYPGNASGKNTAGTVYTCDDYPAPVVQMVVWDGKFNWDYCTVDLRLEGVNDCGTGGTIASIAGDIATEAGDNIAGVEVNLEGLSNPEYKLSDMTSDDGAYAFMDNPMYNAYEISAAKGGDDSKYVSTLDLVMIQRHILGLAEFTSPYKVIASDINNSGDISATDLIILRKLILGIYDELPSNESWRFIDASLELTAENALDNRSEIINISALDANMSNENFVAVKIGDVNGDAGSNARGLTVRNANTTTLTITDRNVKAGETVDITFASSDFNNVYGYQFTLELNGLQFEGIKAGAANMSDDNVALLDANTLSVSYADIAGLNASNNVFTLSAKATQDGALSSMVNINSNTLSSEAYSGSTLEISTVELTLEGQNISTFELGQNEPNPFNDYTVVGFNLPEAGKGQITVYDVAGKVLTLRKGEYNRGYNTEKFTKNELGTTGVLYYTLESGDYTATKKMIIIE